MHLPLGYSPVTPLSPPRGDQPQQSARNLLKVPSTAKADADTVERLRKIIQMVLHEPQCPQ